MKITIFGASGKTGKAFINQALEKGHEIKAFVRNRDKLPIIHPKLEIIEGELNEEEKLSKAILGSDVCISTLGGASLTKKSPEIVAGIEKIVNEIQKQNVHHLLYLSSLGANESKQYFPQPVRFLICDLVLRVPLSDHNKNETFIKNSALKWTIIRPSGLTDGALTEKIQFGFEPTTIKGNHSISRENVAHFMLQECENKKYENKSIWMFE